MGMSIDPKVSKEPMKVISNVVIIHVTGGEVSIDYPSVCEVKGEQYFVGRYIDEEKGKYEINLFPLANILHIKEKHEWLIC